MTYVRVDDAGLHITVERRRREVLEVDHVVVCAGQESVRDLRRPTGPAHLIGGADVAAELDAKRAIEQGTRVVAAL